MAAQTRTETLRQRLDEAEAALHKLATGAATAELQYDGRRISYTQSNVGELVAYISYLKEQLAATEGQGAGRTFQPVTSRGLY